MSLLRPRWPVLLALVTVASLAVHAAAHGLLWTGAPAHSHHHAAGTTTHWRDCALVCGGILAAAFAGYLAASVVRGRPARPPLVLAALLPPLGFALSGAGSARSLALGLLLQLPVAALFVLLTRLLPARAAALGRRLRAQPRPRIAPVRPIVLRAPVRTAPALLLLAHSAPERGPPLRHRA